MKYRIIEVEGGYEIEAKALFFWSNLNHGGFVARVPFGSIEEAETYIRSLSKPKGRVVKEISA